MASADYKLCDICNAKTYYDANIEYDFSRAEYEGCGQSRALCEECGKEWQLVSVRRNNA